MYTESLKEITSVDGRRVVIEEVLTPNGFVSPFNGDVYVAMLWACDDTFNADGRIEVATALIRSGCRYIVCGGVNCEAWHDYADLAWVNLDLLPGSSGETPAVMTSWHANESEKDVIWFAFNCTSFEEHDFRKFLFVLVGHDPLTQTRIEGLIQAAFSPN